MNNDNQDDMHGKSDKKLVLRAIIYAVAAAAAILIITSLI